MTQRLLDSQTGSSPTDRSRLSSAVRFIGSRIPLLLLAALAFFLGCFEMGNYDIWWHLRTGQLIPQRGVPLTDWYSFGSEGNAWIDVHWGFQLLMATIHGRYGIPGMILTKAIIGTAAVVLCLLAYNRHWPVTVQVIVWLPALLLLSSRLYVRPEICTLFFTAVYLCVLFHAEKSPWLLWLLPVAQVLWSNCQGLFIFGPILLAMYFAEAIARLGQVRGVFRHLIPVTLLVAVACCISPYRIGNVLFVFELWTRMRPEGQVFRENIAELMDLNTFWRRGGYGNEYVWMLVTLLGLSVVSVVAAWREILVNRRLFRLLPLVAFGWLSWQATRNGNHFALVAGTIISWNFASAIGERSFRWVAPCFNAALVLAVGYFVVHGDWYERVGGHRRTGFRERQGFYSHEAVRIAGLPGMPERAAIIHMGHAALYIFHNGPEKQVLFDGRLEVHSQAEFERYMAWQDLLTKGEDWESFLKSLDINLMIIDAEHNHVSQVTAFMSPNWRCVHFDDVLAVFVRRDWQLPEGVTEFDFQYWLFDGRLPLFQSPRPQPVAKPSWWLLPPDIVFPDQSDRLAERLYNLSLAMGERTLGVSPLETTLLLNGLKQSQLAIRRRPWSAETYRRMGMQYLLAARMASLKEQTPTVTAPWQSTSGTLFATAVHCLQLALECDPNDYSSHVYLYEAASNAGMLDKSLFHLQKMLELPADNPARMQLRRQLGTVATQLAGRVEAAKKTLDLDDLSFDGLTKYADAGLLAMGLERIDGEAVKALTPEQVDRVGVWHLMAGQSEKAKSIYRSAKGLRPAIQELRLAACEHVLGNYEQARQHLLELLQHSSDQQAEHFDALFGLASLNVLAADMQQAKVYAGRLQSLPQTAQQRWLVQWLNGMFPKDDTR